MGAAAAAIVAAQMRHIIQAFRNARATGPDAARSLSDLNVGETGIFRRLVNSGAIKMASPGTYYLDEPAYEVIMARRRMVAGIMVLVLALLGAVFAFYASVKVTR